MRDRGSGILGCRVYSDDRVQGKEITCSSGQGSKVFWVLEVKGVRLKLWRFQKSAHGIRFLTADIRGI